MKDLLEESSVSFRLSSLEVARKLLQKNNTLLGFSWDFYLGQKSPANCFAWNRIPRHGTYATPSKLQDSSHLNTILLCCINMHKPHAACWIFRWNHLFKDLFCSPSFARICDLFQAQDLVDALTAGLCRYKWCRCVYPCLLDVSP